MLIKGVLLDLDNTLYDYDICNNNALKKVFATVSKKYNLSDDNVKKSFYKTRDQVKKILGRTASSHSRLLYFKKMIENLKDFTDPKFSLDLHEIFWKEYFKYMNLKKDAKKFLDFCKKNKIKIAIVTDLTTGIQLKKIIHLRIAKYIDFVITSEEIGKEKPDPSIFHTALEKLNCMPKEVIMIGDNYYRDIHSAKKLGISAYKSFDEIPLNFRKVHK